MRALQTNYTRGKIKLSTMLRTRADVGVIADMQSKETLQWKPKSTVQENNSQRPHREVALTKQQTRSMWCILETYAR